jgi:hypothetical protein
MFASALAAMKESEQRAVACYPELYETVLVERLLGDLLEVGHALRHDSLPHDGI